MSVLSQKDWNDSKKLGRAKWSLLYGFAFAMVFTLFWELLNYFRDIFILEEAFKTLVLGFVFATVFNFVLFWQYNKWRYRDKTQP